MVMDDNLERLIAKHGLHRLINLLTEQADNAIGLFFDAADDTNSLPNDFHRRCLPSVGLQGNRYSLFKL